MAGLIGVFGGTFDPPHLGHLILADEAAAALDLEKVLWVVTGAPPHKPEPPRASVEERLEMVSTAIADAPSFEISRADVDRPPPHYALGTLAWLRERQPSARWAYLMGSDSLVDLPRWHRAQDFLGALELLGVMMRPGQTLDLSALEDVLPGLESKCRVFEAPLVGISARDIRRRIRGGLPFRYLVPPGVPDVILRHHLYTGAPSA
ncbi:MAG: nicotinate-nucleotide adenylyltransferase [Anaerolineales bacterium]